MSNDFWVGGVGVATDGDSFWTGNSANTVGSPYIFNPTGTNDDDLAIAKLIYGGLTSICCRKGTASNPFRIGNNLVIGKSNIDLFTDDGSYFTEAYNGNYGVKDSVSGGIESSLVSPGIANTGKLIIQALNGVNYLASSADNAAELAVPMQILSSSGIGVPPSPLQLNTTYYLIDARVRQPFVDTTGMRTCGLFRFSTSPWGTEIPLTDAGTNVADLVLARNGFSSAGVDTGTGTIELNLFDSGELNVGDWVVISNLTQTGTPPSFASGATVPVCITSKDGNEYVFGHSRNDPNPVTITNGDSNRVYQLTKVVEGIKIRGINFDTTISGTAPSLNAGVQYQINVSGFETSDCTFRTNAPRSTLSQFDMRGSGHTVIRNTMHYTLVNRGICASSNNILRGTYVAFNEFLLDGQMSGTDITFNVNSVGNVAEFNRLTNNSPANTSISNLGTNNLLGTNF